MPDIPKTDDNSMGIIKESTMSGAKKLDNDVDFTAFGPVPHKDGLSFINIIHPGFKTETVLLINTETKIKQNGPFFCKWTSGKIRQGFVNWRVSKKILEKELNSKIFYRRYTSKWKKVEEHEYNKETMAWHQNEIN